MHVFMITAYELTWVAGDLRGCIRQGGQQRRLSRIWKPDGEKSSHKPLCELMERKRLLTLCTHPTRPMSAMSLRSSLISFDWPLLGRKEEEKEPPCPPLATSTRSPSAFKSPYGGEQQHNHQVRPSGKE